MHWDTFGRMRDTHSLYVAKSITGALTRLGPVTGRHLDEVQEKKAGLGAWRAATVRHHAR